MVHLVALEQDGLDDVVADHLEVRFADVVLDVLLGSREEVVEAHDVIAAGHEVVDEVRAHEARAARDKDTVDALDPGAGLGLDEGVALLVHRCGLSMRRAAPLRSVVMGLRLGARPLEP